MLIFLIGMPGAGKSTLGACLAKTLDYRFLDLDRAIEQAEQKTIPELFAEKGEAYFRQAEARELRKLQGAQQTVIATGGGAPCFFENIYWMNEQGLTIFLDVPPVVLVERLKEQKNRPLLTNSVQNLLQKLEETLSIRMQYYEMAAVKVPASAIGALELAQLVREHQTNS